MKVPELSSLLENCMLKLIYSASVHEHCKAVVSCYCSCALLDKINPIFARKTCATNFFNVTVKSGCRLYANFTWRPCFTAARVVLM